MVGLSAAKADSERTWLADLDQMRRQAKARFYDVAWAGDDPGRVVYGHKCIVYARATGSFQQRYLGVPHSISESDLSLYNSLRTCTPASSATHHGGSLAPTPTPRDQSLTPRPSSSTDRSGSSETIPASPRVLSLGATDINVFEAALEYFYTAGKEAEAFALVLDGFQDGIEDGEEREEAVAKLRQDLMFCWRSKLYADVSLILEGSDSSSPFTAHRAIVASRSPYFRSLLLGNYSDSTRTTFTLPSPPFTPASTTFILGYIYSGTLDFSPRKFDLSTSFEIWRAAAFLNMSALQNEIEQKIIGSMLNLSRAARVFAFAHAADVSSSALAKAALPLVLDHFEETWASPPIGLLPYEAQKNLVRQVCAAVKPDTLAKAARKVASLRKRIEMEKAVWADHVRSMLEAIEEELVAVLAMGLPKTVASAGFVDLIDGVGFSTDVLEWLLTLVVKGLTEAKAPESYQVLVGSVLLREEGILADARVLVEDAKNGILKYIKRKWINIRAAGGFDDLESWCLKELADELDMSTEDLTAEGPRLRPSPARATRQPPKQLVEGTPSIVSPRRRPSEPAPPARAPPPPALSSSTPAASTSTSTSSPPPPPQQQQQQQRPARAPRLSNASTVSRATVASADAARTRPRPSLPSSTAVAASPSPGSSPAIRTARPPPARGTPTRPPGAAAPRPPNGSSATPSTSSSTSPSASRPPLPSSSSASRPSPSSSASTSTAPTPRSRVSSSSSTRPPPAASSSAPSSSAAPLPPAARTAATAARRPSSPAPSVASRRTVGPTATATGRVGGTPRTAAAVGAGGTIRGTPGASSSPSSSSVTAQARLRKQSSASSVAGGGGGGGGVASGSGSGGGGERPTLRKPASSSSLASTKTKRPGSVASTAATTAAAGRTRTTSASSSSAAARKPPLPASGSKRSIRTSTSSSASPAAAGKSRAPPLPSSATSTSLSKKTPGVPGTTLLSGIPCIVTVRVPGTPRSMRIKAVVRYIGKLVGEEGQWVGVEASAVPREAEGLGWGDGTREGITYFKLSTPAPSSASGRATPSPVGGEPGSASAAAAASSSSSTSASSSLLRPPSKRGVGRRSPSAEPGGAGGGGSGPKKALFVRPEQILYVM
ncbi:hypothetical protein JCM10213_004131 [Rhodosporidiobolus nylandii]